MHIRIQLVSEANLLRSALVSMLEGEADFTVLTPVECLPPCHRACCACDSDLLIIDTISGRNNGTHCLRQISARYPEKKILLIISKEHVSLANELLKNGAMGVISMDIDPRAFIQAILTVAAGKPFIDPHLLEAMQESPYSDATNPFDTLSTRERAILELMLNGKSTEECSEQLHISKKTVANHYTSIRKKLAVTDSVQLTRLAVRHNVIKA